MVPDYVVEAAFAAVNSYRADHGIAQAFSMSEARVAAEATWPNAREAGYEEGYEAGYHWGVEDGRADPNQWGWKMGEPSGGRMRDNMNEFGKSFDEVLETAFAYGLGYGLFLAGVDIDNEPGNVLTNEDYLRVYREFRDELAGGE